MSKTKKAILALIFVNTIWGIGAPIFKWSFQDISPVMLAFLRFTIPVVILLPFYRHISRVRMRDAFYFIALGLCNFTFNIGLYFIGINHTASINAPIIASAEPVFILLGSLLFLRDAASKKVLLGNCIGLTGVLFIVLHPLAQNHSVNSLYGNLLLVIATMAAATGTLITKRLTKHYNTLTILFWSFVVAAVSFSPVVFSNIENNIFLFRFAFPSVFAILFGGLISSFICYFLFYWSLHVIKASEVTIFTYVDPIAAMFVAAPLLHEYPDTIFLFGSFMVFFGIYVAEGRLHWHPFHLLFR